MNDYLIIFISDDRSVTTSYYQTQKEFDFAMGTHFCPYEGDGMRSIVIRDNFAVFEEYHPRRYEE